MASGTKDAPVVPHGDQINMDTPVTEIFIAVDVLFFIITIIGNGLIISAIIRNPKLRTPQILFIVSVAMAHLLVGIIVLPMFIVSHYAHEIMDAISCKATAYLTKFASTGSLTAIIPLTLDAFLRTRGYYRNRTLTWTTSLLQVMATWLFAALYAIIHCYMIEFETVTGEDAHGKWHAKICHIPDEDVFAHKVIVMVDFIVLFLLPLIVMSCLLLLILHWFRKSGGDDGLSDEERNRCRLGSKSSAVFLAVFTFFNVGNYLMDLYIFWGPGTFRHIHLFTTIFTLIGFTMCWVNVAMLLVFNVNFRQALCGRKHKSVDDSKPAAETNENEVEMKGKNASNGDGVREHRV